MRRQKQLSFEGKSFEKPKSYFGGAYLKDHNPKTKRPLSSKFAIHLVLRSKQRGMRNSTVFGRVNKTVSKTCKKYGVRLYDFANVGDHLHLLLRLRHILDWAAFIRELT